MVLLRLARSDPGQRASRRSRGDASFEVTRYPRRSREAPTIAVGAATIAAGPRAANRRHSTGFGSTARFQQQIANQQAFGGSRGFLHERETMHGKQANYNAKPKKNVQE